MIERAHEGIEAQVTVKCCEIIGANLRMKAYNLVALHASNQGHLRSSVRDILAIPLIVLQPRRAASGRAGLPTTVAPAGTSFVTTAPMSMTPPAPMPRDTKSVGMGRSGSARVEIGGPQ